MFVPLASSNYGQSKPNQPFHSRVQRPKAKAAVEPGQAFSLCASGLPRFSENTWKNQNCPFGHDAHLCFGHRGVVVHRFRSTSTPPPPPERVPRRAVPVQPVLKYPLAVWCVAYVNMSVSSLVAIQQKKKQTRTRTGDRTGVSGLRTVSNFL